ncbi:hypothetical protein V6Z11_A08G128500 [Gossypium hirsutum]
MGNIDFSGKAHEKYGMLGIPSKLATPLESSWGEVPESPVS